MKHIFLFLPIMLLAGCGSSAGDACVAFCDDQTKIQRAYVKQRDECRQLAELKAGISPGSTGRVNDKNVKNKLITLFSDCMGTKGWTVKDEKKETAPPPPSTKMAEGNPPPPPVKPQQDPRAARAADCAFARQAADSSTIARKRAAACDLECRDMLKLAPDAPRPAACREK